tara:strand:- start:528 stop:1091 length:564 start_codon:yes stop_codon:yes gene_type:complete
MNKAIIIYDCWDKHWYGQQIDLDNNCQKINSLIKKVRSKGYTVIHHPSDCVGKKKTDIKFKSLPKTNYLLDIAEQPAPGVKWKVWSKQNSNIEIEKEDHITESIDDLVNILVSKKIEYLYYIGYHINLCILWARETSIGNLKQVIDIETFIIKDLSEALLKNQKDLQSVYDICETDYNTKLINSEKL